MAKIKSLETRISEESLLFNLSMAYYVPVHLWRMFVVSIAGKFPGLGYPWDTAPTSDPQVLKTSCSMPLEYVVDLCMLFLFFLCDVIGSDT